MINKKLRIVMTSRLINLCVCLFIALLAPITYGATNDPLPSWNNGAIKKNIIAFVQAVTNKNSKDYVTPSDRIATIDNDGTLWLEQPLYTQLIFAISRYEELAKDHPQWQQTTLFKILAAHQFSQLSKADLEKLIAITSSNISVENYLVTVKNWLAVAKNPRFKKHYTELVYQPMLEVLNYLHDNNFRVYIVSGGEQDFIRAFSENIYHTSPEAVLGSTTKYAYTDQNKQPQLIKTSTLLFICDKAGKPEAINLFIGKKPIIAFGNSDGDREMLEWTQSNNKLHLMLLVHHDDAKREYAYDTQSPIGTFSKSLMKEAEDNSWQVISMKNDWRVIFP
jgi:phosphoglycolate phosphatase-like HAD superfamily hydrolase